MAHPDRLPEGFKMTELGPLPEEWRVVRLGEVGKVITGRTPSTANPEYWNGAIPFITPADLAGSLVRTAKRSLTTKGLTQSKPIPRGSVLVSCIGYIGKIGVVDVEIAATNQQINAVIPRDTIDNWYLAFALMQEKPVLVSRARMTTVPILHKSNFEKVPIPLPPLPEQQAIAQVLRTVQEAKEATERVIRAARELKKSLMRHLFTYGPVPLEEADRVPLQETEIGPIPQHWQVVRLGDLVEQGTLFIKNGFPQGEHNQSGRGIPHLRPFNISDDGRIDLSQIKYVPPPPSGSPWWLAKGDVIFNNTNSEELVGKTAFFDLDGSFVLSNHMTLIRVIDSRVIDAYWLAKLLYFQWRSGVFAVLCRRHVNQASVSLERLKGVMIPLPPLPEQQEIARILQAVDEKIKAEEERKEALEALFKSLLHHLMTGKVRVARELEEVKV